LFAEEKVEDDELGTMTMKSNPLSQSKSRSQFAKERGANKPRKNTTRNSSAVEEDHAEDHALVVELTQMGGGSGGGGNDEVNINVVSPVASASAKKIKKKKMKQKATKNGVLTFFTNPALAAESEPEIHTDPNTGRRYTFNPKTRQSVWLSNFE
jgi:hypothetical protein